MKQYIFSLHNQTPKYKQIYERMKTLIENQDILENSLLPPIRKLAENLGVSRNTTLVAYEQLLAEGYIRSEQRRGYFVNPLEPFYIQQKQEKQKAPKNNELPVQVDFRAGAVDQQAFPLNKWRQCANKVLEEGASYTYGNPQGDLLLRDELSSYLFQSRGITASSESIIIGSSTQQLLLHLSILLKQNHSSILVENPGYDGARHVFELQGYQLEAIDVNENGHSLQQLQSSKTRLIYITPSHHFPTGKTMSIQKRQHLLQWARTNDAYIIEDDYDSEFRYEQHPVPALASLEQNNVIYLGTFSKAFLPSIRLGYMILPPALLKKYQLSILKMEQNASFLHQRTMASFMNLGYWESHIRKMRSIYKKKMPHLVTTLYNTFGEKIEVIGGNSGLYVLIQVQTEMTETQLIESAYNIGVKVYPTSPYFIRQQPKAPLLQIGFSNCSISRIEEGVRLLKIAWLN